MEIEEIFVKVKSAIIDACDAEDAEVTLDKSLIDGLGVDSIDLMDIIYNLEREFKVSIEIGNFEKLAQDKMQGENLHINGVITSEGIATLKALMPEVPDDKFVEGLTIYKMPYLFTVHSLCNLVQEKLNVKSQENK